MAVDGNVFFEPLIDCSEVNLDQVLKRIGLEDDDTVSGLISDRQVPEMSCAVGAFNRFCLS